MTEEQVKALSKEDVTKIIKSYTDMLGDVLVTELDNIMTKFGMESVPAEMFPYLAALSTLAFCAKDLDKESLIALLSSVDIIPDTDLVNKVSALKMKNYVIYVHILYFLHDVKKEPTVDDMMRTAKSLGFNPDVKLANLVYNLYMKKHA